MFFTIFQALIFFFVVFCSYYKGTKFIVFWNFFLVASAASLLFFFDSPNITILGDTVLVIVFIINLFYFHYSKLNPSLYNKIMAPILFVNAILLIVYFFAMLYDISLGCSLEPDASPLKWFVDLASDHF